MYDKPTFIHVSNLRMTDINPISTGYEDCHPQKYNPYVYYNYVILHYVERGKGFLIKNGKEYAVKAGQMFIVTPGELCGWHPDRDDPWFYRWIAFNGSLSCKFRHLPCVMDYSPDIFRRANETENFDGKRSYMLAGLIFELCADLFREPQSSGHYVEEIKDFIDSSYMKDITVEQIASMFDRDPKYLTTLFRKKTGKSIHEYLTHIRMNAAKLHIASGMSVTDTALVCGYSDISNFSKNYKKHFGISPLKWKKQFENK